MASAIFTTSQSGPGVQGTLTTEYDGAYVAAGVVVGSTDSAGIQGLAGHHYVTIAGTLIGDESGVELGRNSFTDSGERVVVRAGGEVYGYGVYGVLIDGSNSSVSKAGYIYGEEYGVLMANGSAGSTSVINNTGEIESQISGITHVASDILIVNNSGTISGGILSFGDSISGSEAIDKITNSGTMIGAVALDRGADLYDGRTGHVQGTIFGGAGNDTIYGGTDADTIDGGTGADTMAGGAGDDTYYVDVYADQVTEAADQGTDTISVAMPYTLGANIENLTLTGMFVINGTGNGLANVITGNVAVNTLQGGDGNDTIVGGGGADRLYGNAGSDTFVFKDISDSALSARDGIYDFVEGGTDKIDLSGIDANQTAGATGDQAFTLVSAYSGVAGQLRTFSNSTQTYVEGDVNGDRKADFQIVLSGVHSLHQGDFVL